MQHSVLNWQVCAALPTLILFFSSPQTTRQCPIAPSCYLTVWWLVCHSEALEGVESSDGVLISKFHIAFPRLIISHKSRRTKFQRPVTPGCLADGKWKQNQERRKVFILKYNVMRTDVREGGSKVILLWNGPGTRKSWLAFLGLFSYSWVLMEANPQRTMLLSSSALETQLTSTQCVRSPFQWHLSSPGGSRLFIYFWRQSLESSLWMNVPPRTLTLFQCLSWASPRLSPGLP